MDSHEKRLVRALKGEVLEYPPVWLMRQAGRYLPEYRQTRKRAKHFLDLCYTPDLAVEVTLQPIERFDLDASIMFSDILVIPDALGQRVEFHEGQGPVLELVQTAADLDRLRVDGYLDHLAPVFEIIRRLRQELPVDKTLIGFAGSPWTVAIYMVEGRGGTDGGKAREWAYNDPATFSGLIDILTEATTGYLLAQITHGAEVIQLFDSWSGLLPETQFNKWVIEPTRRIVEGIHAVHPQVPVIGFPRGSGPMAADFVRRTGVQGISLDSGIPLDHARQHLQPLATVQGNLDNRLLVSGGAEMDREVRRILDSLGQGPFIFNLGHGILPHTPPGHVTRLVELVRSYDKGADI